MIEDELFYDAVALLERLVASPSVSRSEADAASAVEEALRSAGFTPERRYNNVWAVAPGFDPALPTLLLNSHIDTVSPVASWTRNPFEPVRDEEDPDRLYGLGSNDAGASLVALLAAFRAIADDNHRAYNLVFLASAEEEVSGEHGLRAVVDLIPRPDFAIVGEPTGMLPALAEKGLMVLDGEVTGVAGHAARNEGVNAIYKAIPIVERLARLEFPKVSRLLGPVKISVTGISAGTRHNVVPDLCKLVVDVRTTDVYTNLETLEMIQSACPEATFTPRSTRLNPSSAPDTHPVVERLRMMGRDGFGSPTLSDQALMPWPSLKLGPGDSARSHTADEYIMLPEIREAISIYIRLLSGLKLS